MSESTSNDTQLKYPLQATRQHDYYDGCGTGDCGGTCYYCTLSICKVCGGAEGSLTSDCPGTKVTGKIDDMVYGGIIDYRNGHWLHGFKNRGMYKDPFDYIETEKMYQEILKAQPSLDMFAVKESKHYQGIGEDWLKKCHETQTSRDLQYIDRLTNQMTYSKVKRALQHLNYHNTLSDEVMKTITPDDLYNTSDKVSRDAKLVTLQAGSNIKEHALQHLPSAKLTYITSKDYPELGAYLELEKYEWKSILSALTTDRMINNSNYTLITKAIVDILRPTWER
ncbi:MAG: hypothetical protein ABS904_00485 [Solibacillus isronensis]